MQINLDLRQRECLIALAEQEIREWEGIIASLKAGDDVDPAKLVKIATAPGSDATPSETTTRKSRGRRKVKDAKPKTPAKVGRRPRAVRSAKSTPAKKVYYVSLPDIVRLLRKTGEPMTPFKIKQGLLERYNIVATDEQMSKQLKRGIESEAFCSPQQGEYALPN